MRRSLLLLILLLWAMPARAQTPPAAAPITSYQLQVFQNGSLVMGLGEKQLGLNEWTCGQTPAAGNAPATMVNPTRIEIDDPASTATPKLKCVTSQTAFFRALPTGTNYRAILFALSNVAQPPNDKSNPLVIIPDFQVIPVYGPPAAPTGGRLLP